MLRIDKFTGEAGRLILSVVLLATSMATVATAQGPNPRPHLWADGILFASVVTRATFHPGAGNFDELYVSPGGFRDGDQLISESRPGDTDFNGGRWHMNVLRGDVPAGKYASADRVEALDLADFESTDNYFECPVLPRRVR